MSSYKPLTDDELAPGAPLPPLHRLLEQARRANRLAKAVKEIQAALRSYLGEDEQCQHRTVSVLPKLRRKSPRRRAMTTTDLIAKALEKAWNTDVPSELTPQITAALAVLSQLVQEEQWGHLSSECMLLVQAWAVAVLGTEGGET